MVEEEDGGEGEGGGKGGEGEGVMVGDMHGYDRPIDYVR